MRPEVRRLVRSLASTPIRQASPICAWATTVIAAPTAKSSAPPPIRAGLNEPGTRTMATSGATTKPTQAEEAVVSCESGGAEPAR